jgi:hypothetical protein
MVDTGLAILGTVRRLRAIGPGIPAIVLRLLGIGLRPMGIVLDIRVTVGRRQLRFQLPALGIRTDLVQILRPPRFRLPALGIRTDLARIHRGLGREEELLRRNR